MSAPASIYHRGVLKVAGAVHVGPPEEQVGQYLRDAQAYGERAVALPGFHAELARLEVERSDECHRRALISATVAMLTWGLS